MHEIGGFKTPRRKFKLIILKIISYCGGVKLNRRSSQQNVIRRMSQTHMHEIGRFKTPRSKFKLLAAAEE
jgi:hypothetical protein